MECDTLIIGAGAAGLFCAAHTPGRTLLVDHAKAPGEKIRISGGGRCNFTNLQCDAHAFLSENPHFAKSALAGYTQWDFIDLVDRYGIAWHEKTLGQLFCDGKSKEIVAMLLDLVRQAGAALHLNTSVRDLRQDNGGFSAQLNGSLNAAVKARRVVIATGGKSIPKMGATGFAYDIARSFGLAVTQTRPALVPYTFADQRFSALSGVSVPSSVTAGAGRFDEALLFTHRGLSGPAVLQSSSYWREGMDVQVNLLPGLDVEDWLMGQKQSSGKAQVSTVLSRYLPARLIEFLDGQIDLKGRLADLPKARINEIAAHLQHWRLTPQGTEGYRTAEVTLGGISTEALQSKTLEAKSVPGLYFIGECVDVTGWLGGYNFQWAWSSGIAAARALGA